MTPNLQRAAEDRVSAYLARLPARTSAALLVVDNATLEARVYVGTAEFADPLRLGHVDMVRAPRSPGSTLKPFLYGLALDDGLLDSQSLLVDAPQDFGGYQPGNFDEAFSGPVSAAEALQRSLNVPAVDVLERVGPDPLRGASGQWRHRSGSARRRATEPVDHPGRRVHCAGTPGRRVHRVRQRRHRRHAALHRAKLRSRGGCCRRGAAWIIRDILASNPAEVDGGPLAGAIDRHGTVAWKTGTSYGYRDAWAIGVTDRWTDRRLDRPSRRHAVARPVRRGDRFAAAVPDRRHAAATWWSRACAQPASVRAREICWPLGGAADDHAADLCRQRRTAWVLDGALPPTFAERDLGAWSAGLLTLRVNAAVNG